MSWTSGKIAKSLKLFAINILVLVALFLVVEVAGRTYHMATTENGNFFRPKLFISPWFTTLDRPRPIFSYVNKELHGTFNHASEATPAKKPKNSIRIIAVGGSTTANNKAWRTAGIDYSSELQRLLQQKFPDKAVEVLNAGGEGFSSAHSLVNLSTRLITFNPDLIIVMHNANDRSVAYFGEEVFPDYANKYMHPTYLAPAIQKFDGWYGTLVQSRVLSSMGIAKIFAPRQVVVPETISVESHAFTEELFLRNMSFIANIARSSDSRILFLSQPFDKNRMRKETTVDQVRYNSLVHDLSEEIQVPYFDMATSFGSEARLFLDPIHYSPEGIRRFSELLTIPVITVLQKRRQ